MDILLHLKEMFFDVMVMMTATMAFILDAMSQKEIGSVKPTQNK